jgi:hypothetical protein
VVRRVVHSGREGTVSIIGLLVALVIVCLLFWAVTRILAAFSIGDPIATVVRVILVVLVVLWLISEFGFGAGLPRLR